MASPKFVIVSSREHSFIWMAGLIEPGAARKFQKHFKKVRGHQPCDEPLVVYLTGPGGWKGEMLEMYDMIERSPRHIVTVGHRSVRSAAFLLLQSGHTRCAVSETSFMFHRTLLLLHTINEGLEINIDHIEDFREHLHRFDAQSLSIFTRRGRPYDAIAHFFERDAVIGTRTALKHKLIDGMYSQDVYRHHKRIAQGLIHKTENPEIIIEMPDALK